MYWLDTNLQKNQLQSHLCTWSKANLSEGNCVLHAAPAPVELTYDIYIAQITLCPGTIVLSMYIMLLYVFKTWFIIKTVYPSFYV